MSRESMSPIQQLNEVLNHARSIGIAQQVDEEDSHDGRSVMINGRESINFGSCGYMGLEFEPRVTAGAIEAIRKYGFVFNCSRSYLSNQMYPVLENLLEKIFLRPTLVAPTTTLLHLSSLPVLIDSDDVVLLDQQVHSSVQLAAKVLKANGTQIDYVPHNHVARIERKIKSYKDSKKKIWYLGDGVYSMYGDFAPAKELQQLLGLYEQFHLYFDDAHGMSWKGKRGSGYVLENMTEHERLYVAVSLAKGFGTGGGAIACPNKEVKQLIRNCGGTQIFAGPLQPAILGAAVESAKLHLSPEFPAMQKELHDLNKFCTESAENLPLPMISAPDSPVRFVGVGQTEKAQQIVKHVINQGFWLNIAQFPAVAPNHAGVRFMMTRKLSNRDIGNFMDALRNAAYEILGKDEETYSQIWKAFSKEYRYSLANG